MIRVLVSVVVVVSLFSPLGCFDGSGGDDEVEPLVVIEGAGAVTCVTMPVDRPLQLKGDFSPFGGDSDIFEITFPEDGEFTYTVRWATSNLAGTYSVRDQAGSTTYGTFNPTVSYTDSVLSGEVRRVYCVQGGFWTTAEYDYTVTITKQ